MERKIEGHVQVVMDVTLPSDPGESQVHMVLLDVDPREEGTANLQQVLRVLHAQHGELPVKITIEWNDPA